MSVSGLAITLSDDPDLADSAVRAIESNPCVETGPRNGCHIAATLDTPSTKQDRALWDWLHGIPGIVHVDVVCVHFDDAKTVEPET